MLGRQTRIWLYCRQNYKRWLKYLLYVSIPAILYSWIASNFPALKIWEKQNVPLKLGDAVIVAQKQDIAPKQENVAQQEEKVFISEKSAREIFAYIETILPLQRSTVIKTSYIGRLVRWKGKIRNILDREGITMISIVQDDIADFIFIKFTSEWYKNIETFRIGDYVIFAGKITDIEAYGAIFLDGSELVKFVPQESQTELRKPTDDVQQRNPVREKSAYELITHLKTLPPLQREAVVKSSYIGRWVHWEGKVVNVEPFRNGFLVSVSGVDDRVALSHLELPDTWRDRVDALRNGDTLVFEGKISSCSTSSVILTEASFVKSDPVKSKTKKKIR